MSSKRAKASKKSDQKSVLDPQTMSQVSQSIPREKYKRPGKPTKYKPEYCDEIIDSGIRGLTFKEFASQIDVHTDTLLEWRNVHKEFKSAYNRAKQEQENFLMRIGRVGLFGQKRMVNGKLVTPYFNTAVWIFMLKARHGWRENDLVVPEEDADFEFVE